MAILLTKFTSTFYLKRIDLNSIGSREIYVNYLYDCLYFYKMEVYFYFEKQLFEVYFYSLSQVMIRCGSCEVTVRVKIGVRSAE